MIAVAAVGGTPEGPLAPLAVATRFDGGAGEQPTYDAVSFNAADCVWCDHEPTAPPDNDDPARGLLSPGYRRYNARRVGVGARRAQLEEMMMRYLKRGLIAALVAVGITVWTANAVQAYSIFWWLQR